MSSNKFKCNLLVRVLYAAYRFRHFTKQASLHTLLTLNFHGKLKQSSSNLSTKFRDVSLCLAVSNSDDMAPYFTKRGKYKLEGAAERRKVEKSGRESTLGVEACSEFEMRAVISKSEAGIYRDSLSLPLALFVVS